MVKKSGWIAALGTVPVALVISVMLTCGGYKAKVDQLYTTRPIIAQQVTQNRVDMAEIKAMIKDQNEDLTEIKEELRELRKMLSPKLCSLSKPSKPSDILDPYLDNPVINY